MQKPLVRYDVFDIEEEGLRARRVKRIDHKTEDGVPHLRFVRSQVQVSSGLDLPFFYVHAEAGKDWPDVRHRFPARQPSCRKLVAIHIILQSHRYRPTLQVWLQQASKRTVSSVVPQAYLGSPGLVPRNRAFHDNVLQYYISASSALVNNASSPATVVLQTAAYFSCPLCVSYPSSSGPPALSLHHNFSQE